MAYASLETRTARKLQCTQAAGKSLNKCEWNTRSFQTSLPRRPSCKLAPVVACACSEAENASSVAALWMPVLHTAFCCLPASRPSPRQLGLVDHQLRTLVPAPRLNPSQYISMAALGPCLAAQPWPHRRRTRLHTVCMAPSGRDRHVKAQESAAQDAGTRVARGSRSTPSTVSAQGPAPQFAPVQGLSGLPQGPCPWLCAGCHWPARELSRASQA